MRSGTACAGSAFQVDALDRRRVAATFVLALILFLSLLPFFAFKNVTRAIGAKRMKENSFLSARFRTELKRLAR